MELKEAKKIADKIIADLSPYCEEGYCKVAGSVRREKPFIEHDIEMVCIPKLIQVPDGLFTKIPARMDGFINYLNSFPKAKGDAVVGKQIQRILPCGLQLDLYIADKVNWGYIYAIRTGSADFSHNILAKGWKARHFYGEKGYLHNPGGSVHPVPDEEYFFKLLGMEWIEPRFRSITIQK